MSTYQIHGIDTAPDNSKPLLQGLQKNLGLIPNLAAAMAESPELLKGFLAAREIYTGGTFTPLEIEVLAALRGSCPASWTTTSVRFVW